MHKVGLSGYTKVEIGAIKRMICLQKRHSKTVVLLLKVIALLIPLVLFIIYRKELVAFFSNGEVLEDTLNKLGPFAWLGFLFVNIIQVILAPIPGHAVGVAGGFLFGFWGGFILNLIGIVVGSALAFLLARWLGKPIVDLCVGDKAADFSKKIASSKGVKGLILVYLLPFLPDDALSFVAGLMPIKFRTFITIVSLCRSPGILVASLTGSGLINLSLFAWVVIGALALILLAIYWIKGEQIEAWMKKIVQEL